MSEKIIVILLVAAAVLTAGLVIYRSLTGKGGCSGCCFSDRCESITRKRKGTPADPDPRAERTTNSAEQ